jgi:NAD(P)-dependent dehydrogenase (short-subunit alcohol dehydrogenase family)
MAGRLEGKVALISGAARGQGRSHAAQLAQEGADIIAFDVCRQLDTVPYSMAASADIAETAKLVEEHDRRIVAREADVPDGAAVQALVDEGVREFGRLDMVCANAGIAGVVKNTWTMSDDEWEEMIAVDLTGVWKTVKAAVPAMIQASNGGTIIITNSAFGVKGVTGMAHYVSANTAWSV